MLPSSNLVFQNGSGGFFWTSVLVCGPCMFVKKIGIVLLNFCKFQNFEPSLLQISIKNLTLKKKIASLVLVNK